MCLWKVDSALKSMWFPLILAKHGTVKLKLPCVLLNEAVWRYTLLLHCPLSANALSLTLILWSYKPVYLSWKIPDTIICWYVLIFFTFTLEEKLLVQTVMLLYTFTASAWEMQDASEWKQILLAVPSPKQDAIIVFIRSESYFFIIKKCQIQLRSMVWSTLHVCNRYRIPIHALDICDLSHNPLHTVCVNVIWNNCIADFSNQSKVKICNLRRSSWL